MVDYRNSSTARLLLQPPASTIGEDAHPKSIAFIASVFGFAAAAI